MLFVCPKNLDHLSQILFHIVITYCAKFLTRRSSRFSNSRTMPEKLDNVDKENNKNEVSEVLTKKGCFLHGRPQSLMIRSKYLIRVNANIIQILI